MTEEEYQKAKQAIKEYETKKAQRDLYVDIRNSADTLAIRDGKGREIVLTGAEPLSRIIEYVNEKIAEIDGEQEAIPAPKV